MSDIDDDSSFSQVSIGGTGLGNALDRRFYVYLIRRPNGVPCYVGKGTRRRFRLTPRVTTNLHLRRIYAAAGGSLQTDIIENNLTNSEALELEIFLIGEIGRAARGGPLVNLTDGGDGKLGYPTPDETREKIRIANTGKRLSEVTKQLMSRQRLGKRKPETFGGKISQALKGRKFSAATRAKLRASSALRWARPESRVALVSYHANMTDSERAERAQKISEATRIAMRDPSITAKISAARRTR